MEHFNLNDLARRAEDSRLRLRQSLDDKMAEMAGTHLPKMLESTDGAADFLKSGVPALRRAAVLAIAFHWHVLPATRYAADILAIATSDNDPQVRREAIGAVGAVFRETDDVEAGYVLARLVMDKSETYEIRREAFLGLCFLRAAFKESSAISAFPDGVDWLFVTRFLDRSRSPEPPDPIETFTRLFPFPIAESHIESMKRRKADGGIQEGHDSRDTNRY